MGIGLVLLVGSGCQYNQTERLPVLSSKKLVEGRKVYDTIPPFSLLNQDSQIINNATFAGKAYVADFFFLSCPTICPLMQANMLRIYERFEQEPDLLLLSHSIDPERDTIPRLRQYADNLGVDHRKWHFAYGDKEEIYELADDYFNIVVEDETLPEGFDHSGRLVLIGPRGHVRAFALGTDSTAVDQLMMDIETLLDEI